MPDRFDLETQILNFNSVADDLDVIVDHILEHDSEPDEIANAVGGLAALVRMKTAKTFDTFKAAFQLDEYSPERQKYEGRS
jgi:hypothetical protein